MDVYACGTLVSVCFTDQKRYVASMFAIDLMKPYALAASALEEVTCADSFDSFSSPFDTAAQCRHDSRHYRELRPGAQPAHNCDPTRIWRQRMRKRPFRTQLSHGPESQCFRQCW